MDLNKWKAIVTEKTYFGRIFLIDDSPADNLTIEEYGEFRNFLKRLDDMAQVSLF